MRTGYRFNRYHELGQYAFGPKLGLWMVIPFQLIVMVGLGMCAFCGALVLHGGCQMCWSSAYSMTSKRTFFVITA